ncbi:tetratricopeptide repeat-containing glycosyltransferase family protein [Azospirillum sp.]|uniref:tetratricopeptide repeat-containing glycosyltransferase family protein n=1 Tax=Azospirillum sp. TaxID=34012 RepID=UPI00260E8A19|nr:tetratricopeptide repeat-containing glycosyltransferase family protein [Azospirillum sp.]
MDGVAALLRQAVAEHRAGRMREAIRLYGKVLSMDPDNPDALHLLGVVARRQGKLDLAIQLMRRALQKNPYLIDGYLNCGNTLFEAGRLEEAEDSFRRILRYDPGHVGVLAPLGRLLLRRGALDEGEALLARAFSDGDNPKGRLAMERTRRYRAIAEAAANPSLPAGIVVRGVFRDSSGYAYKVRQFVRHLVKAGVSVQLMDLLYTPTENLPASQLDPLFETLEAPVRAKAVLSFTTPLMVEAVPGLRTINYTVFEATRIPPLWAAHSAQHDHVIVATPSSREAWIASGHPEDRITVCPEGVGVVGADVTRTEVVDDTGRRLLSYPTRFLNVSDFTPRKNLVGLLRVWLASTQASDPAALVLKIGKGGDAAGEFRDFITQTAQSVGTPLEAAAPIFLIADKMSDDAMMSLIASCTHYWSMSHGEGWDLPMAQAGAMGLTLIAPRHSAYLAYLDDEDAHLLPCMVGPAANDYAGLDWWFPDEAAARALLERIIRDPQANRRSARDRLLADFTWEKSAARLIDILSSINAL